MRRPVCQYGFLDADLRGHGCTIASGTYAAREMTDGEAWSDAEAFADGLRQASVPLATFRRRGTTLTELRTGYQSLTFPGRVAPRMALQRGIDVRAELLPMLRDGHLAVVAVNYGVIQDAGKGIGSFRGGHAATIGEPEDSHVTVADPLRRELVRWRISLLVQAMESFGSKPWLNGRGEAVVPLPSPTLLEQATERLAKAKAALALSRRDLDGARTDATLARRAADELRTALTAAEKRIRDLQNAAPDCSVVIAERDGALARAVQEAERADAEADRAMGLERRVADALAVLTR